MPIIDIEEYRKKAPQEPKKGLSIDTKAFYSRFENIRSKTDTPGFLSRLASRFFFIFLLFLNVIWLTLAIAYFACALTLNLVFLRMSIRLGQIQQKAALNMKRAAVCFVALLIALFNPALGIMFSCLYFMMYDKMGIDEIIPASLKEQFKEFFPS